jgi:DNA-binding MarR family transcriptional regulator
MDTKQPGLFDDEPQRARRRDPPTARQYAARVNKGLGAKRIEVLCAVQSAGSTGGTSLELSEQCGMRRESLSPHLRPLERLGYIKEQGTRDGGIVWVINRG